MKHSGENQFKVKTNPAEVTISAWSICMHACMRREAEDSDRDQLYEQEWSLR